MKNLNRAFIEKFNKEETEFEIKTEIAYVIGKDRLDDDFMKFVDEETYIDGIYAFSLFVRYIYEHALKNEYWDIYSLIANEYEELFENFKKDCFIEKEN